MNLLVVILAVALFLITGKPAVQKHELPQKPAATNALEGEAARYLLKRAHLELEQSAAELRNQ